MEKHTDISADQEFVFVNCMPYENTHHEEHLRDHLGTHPAILKEVVDGLAPEWVRPFHEHVARWMTDGSKERPSDMCVVFVSKRETYRSVAARWL